MSYDGSPLYLFDIQKYTLDTHGMVATCCSENVLLISRYSVHYTYLTKSGIALPPLIRHPERRQTEPYAFQLPCPTRPQQ